MDEGINEKGDERFQNIKLNWKELSIKTVFIADRTKARPFMLQGSATCSITFPILSDKSFDFIWFQFQFQQFFD